MECVAGTGGQYRSQAAPCRQPGQANSAWCAVCISKGVLGTVYAIHVEHLYWLACINPAQHCLLRKSPNFVQESPSM